MSQASCVKLRELYILRHLNTQYSAGLVMLIDFKRERRTRLFALVNACARTLQDDDLAVKPRLRQGGWAQGFCVNSEFSGIDA